MSLVCVDTNILIWGIRGVSSSGQGELVRKAKYFVTELTKQKIGVPTPVVSEFLRALPLSQQMNAFSALQNAVQFWPFDVNAAVVAAKLWREYAEKRSGLDESAVVEQNRSRLKFDVQILATAIVRNASVIYTHDSGLIEITKVLSKIPVSKLPELPST